MNVLVIGGGPGGYVAAIRAAQLGAKVTLVEKQYLGGTCLNVGCIPTKCLLHSAELVSQIREQGHDIGVDVDGITVNFSQVIAHKNKISKKLTSGVASLLRMNHVEKVDGEASFVSEKMVEVKKADGSKTALTADAIILATGSVNAVPPHSWCKRKSQLHRFYRCLVTGKTARQHGGHRRRRNWYRDGVRLCCFWHAGRRGGSYGAYAAYVG